VLQSIQPPHIAAFRVDVHPERELVRVAPAGELDLSTAPKLELQLHELRDSGFRRIVLDLRRLTFMDSSGVALILREDRLASAGDHAFSLIAGPPPIQRVLSICGVLDRLPFEGSRIGASATRR